MDDQIKAVVQIPYELFETLKEKMDSLQFGAEINKETQDIYKELKEIKIDADSLNGLTEKDFATALHKHAEIIGLIEDVKANGQTDKAVLAKIAKEIENALENYKLKQAKRNIEVAKEVKTLLKGLDNLGKKQTNLEAKLEAVAKKKTEKLDENLNMDGNKILNLATPSKPKDGANKNYVDTMAQRVLTMVVSRDNSGTTTTPSGGAVDSVNGKVGVVVLTPDDLTDTLTTHKFITSAELSKLSGIETGAEVNNISDANATDLTDGGETNLHTHSGADGGYEIIHVTTNEESLTAVSGRKIILTDFVGSSDSDALYACWEMNESAEYDGTAGEVIDSSIFANNAVGVGYPTKNASGKVGVCRDFDGTSDYAILADATDFDAMTAFTISAWIKTTETGATKTICRREGSWDFAFGWGGTDKLRIWMNSGSWEYAGDSTTQINDGNWHWVVARYDGTDLKLYVDNSQNATASLPARTTGTNTQPLYIGAGNDKFNGSIDQLCIWKRALTADEMTSVYNSGAGRTLDLTGANCSINLPTAVGNEATFTIKQINITPTLISAESGETIDGNQTKTVTTLNSVMTLVSDGTNWQIISSYTP